GGRARCGASQSASLLRVFFKRQGEQAAVFHPDRRRDDRNGAGWQMRSHCTLRTVAGLTATIRDMKPNWGDKPAALPCAPGPNSIAHRCGGAFRPRHSRQSEARSMAYNILILGAAYGSLLASK